MMVGMKKVVGKLGAIAFLSVILCACGADNSTDIAVSGSAVSGDSVNEDLSVTESDIDLQSLVEDRSVLRWEPYGWETDDYYYAIKGENEGLDGDDTDSSDEDYLKQFDHEGNEKWRIREDKILENYVDDIKGYIYTVLSVSDEEVVICADSFGDGSFVCSVPLVKIQDALILDTKSAVKITEVPEDSFEFIGTEFFKTGNWYIFFDGQDILEADCKSGTQNVLSDWRIDYGYSCWSDENDESYSVLKKSGKKYVHRIGSDEMEEFPYTLSEIPACGEGDDAIYISGTMENGRESRDIYVMDKNTLNWDVLCTRNAIEEYIGESPEEPDLVREIKGVRDKVYIELRYGKTTRVIAYDKRLSEFSEVTEIDELVKHLEFKGSKKREHNTPNVHYNSTNVFFNNDNEPGVGVVEYTLTGEYVRSIKADGNFLYVTDTELVFESYEELRGIPLRTVNGNSVPDYQSERVVLKNTEELWKFYKDALDLGDYILYTVKTYDYVMRLYNKNTKETINLDEYEYYLSYQIHGDEIFFIGTYCDDRGDICIYNYKDNTRREIFLKDQFREIGITREEFPQLGSCADEKYIYLDEIKPDTVYRIPFDNPEKLEMFTKIRTQIIGTDWYIKDIGYGEIVYEKEKVDDYIGPELDTYQIYDIEKRESKFVSYGDPEYFSYWIEGEGYYAI